MADVRNDIDRYLNGELSPAEMHALERQALNDPFLAEALEGAGQIAPPEFSDDLRQLRASLQQATKRKNNVVSLRVWSLRVAASLLLLAISTVIIVTLVKDDTADKLALQQEPEPALKKMSPAPRADSVTATEKAPEISTTWKAEPSKPGSISENVQEQEPAPAAVEQRSDEVTEAPVLAPEPAAERSVSEDRADYASTPAPLPPKQEETAMAKEYKTSSIQGYANFAPKKTIRGKVTLADDGTGIPGVNVMVVGTNEGTVTDGEGNYQLRVEDENADLAFSFIGMQSKEVGAQGSEQVDVQLEQDVSQLSEVVVVGYGAEGKAEEEESVFHMASPTGGRAAFKQYLEKSLHYPEQALANDIEGKVTIQFTVESSGRISDFKVLKGIGYGCDEEVIRLIKKGPQMDALQTV